jgi:predicted HAD superfamily Cof-like phosphohydrolase
MEELSELMKAHEKDNLVDAADAIADLAYVTMGCAHHMGIDLPRILNIVHAANMQKVPGTTTRGYQQDAVKPDNWVGPEELIALDLFEQCKR